MGEVVYLIKMKYYLEIWEVGRNEFKTPFYHFKQKVEDRAAALSLLEEKRNEINNIKYIVQFEKFEIDKEIPIELEVLESNL